MQSAQHSLRTTRKAMVPPPATSAEGAQRVLSSAPPPRHAANVCCVQARVAFGHLTARALLLLASTIAVATPLTWTARAFVHRTDAILLPVPPGLGAAHDDAEPSSYAVHAAAPPSVDTMLCAATAAGGAGDADAREVYLARATVQLRTLGPATPQLELLVFAGAVRSWRHDIVLAAALYPTDATRVRFLWGDHIETERAAAGALFARGECVFESGHRSALIAELGWQDGGGGATLSCARAPGAPLPTTAEPLRFSLELPGAPLALKLAICAAAAPDTAHALHVAATLCTSAPLYGAYADSAVGRLRVVQWVAYHALLGVERAVVYVRDAAARAALLDAFAGRSFTRDCAIEVTVFPRAIALDALVTERARRRAVAAAAVGGLARTSDDVEHYFDQIWAMTHCTLANAERSAWVGYADIDEFYHVTPAPAAPGALVHLLDRLSAHTVSVSARSAMFGRCASDAAPAPRSAGDDPVALVATRQCRGSRIRCGGPGCGEKFWARPRRVKRLEVHAVAAFWGDGDASSDSVPAQLEAERMAHTLSALSKLAGVDVAADAARTRELATHSRATLRDEIAEKRNSAISALAKGLVPAAGAMGGVVCNVAALQQLASHDISDLLHGRRDGVDPPCGTQRAGGRVAAPMPSAMVGGSLRRRRRLYDAPASPLRWDAPPSSLRFNHYACAAPSASTGSSDVGTELVGHDSTQAWCSAPLRDTSAAWAGPHIAALMKREQRAAPLRPRVPPDTLPAEHGGGGAHARAPVEECAADIAPAERCSIAALAARIVRHPNSDAEGERIAAYLARYAALHERTLHDATIAPAERRFVFLFLKWDGDDDTGLGNRAKLLATSLLVAILTHRTLVLAEEGDGVFRFGDFFDVPCFGAQRGWRIDYAASNATFFPRGASAEADYAAYALDATHEVEAWSPFKEALVGKDLNVEYPQPIVALNHLYWYDVGPLLSLNPHYAEEMETYWRIPGRQGLLYRLLFEPREWLRREVNAYLAAHDADASSGGFVGAHARMHHFQIPTTPATMRAFWGCTLRSAQTSAVRIFLATNDRAAVLGNASTGDGTNVTGSGGRLARALLPEYAPATPCGKARISRASHRSIAEMLILSRSAKLHVWALSSFSELAWNLGAMAPPRVIDEKCVALPSTTTASPDTCLHFQRSCIATVDAPWPRPNGIDAAFFGWCDGNVSIDLSLHLSHLSPHCGCFNPSQPRRSWNCELPLASCDGTDGSDAAGGGRDRRRCWEGACCAGEEHNTELRNLRAKRTRAHQKRAAKRRAILASGASDPGDRPLGESRRAWLERSAAPYAASDADDLSCACATPCASHRTDPQDPLMWCAVSSAACLESTRGGEEHRAAARGVDVDAWRHCGANHRFFALPPPEIMSASLIATHPSLLQSTAHATRAELDAALSATTAVRTALEWESGPGLARGARGGAKGTAPRHFVFQTDCAPDGLGANFNYIKVALYVALRLNAQLVWNAANFISENTPQYVNGDGALAFALAETPPGDTFHGFGFDSYLPTAFSDEEGDGDKAQATTRVTPRELFARIRSGELVARPFDTYERNLRRTEARTKWPLQRGADDARRLTRTLRSAMAEEGWNTIGAKQRVILLKSCEGSYRGWDIGGIGTWMRSAFHATRRVLRPTLPSSVSTLLRVPSGTPPPFLVAVHIRLGDCTFGRWKTSATVCAPEGWEATLRLLLGANERSDEAAQHSANEELDNSYISAAQQRRLEVDSGMLPPLPFTCGAAPPQFAPRRAEVAIALVAQAESAAALSPSFMADFGACTGVVLSSLADDRVESATALFEALDVLSSADIVVLSTSSFSRLAAALAPAATVKLVPFPPTGYPDAAVALRGVRGVVEVCGSVSERPGWFAHDQFERAWASRAARFSRIDAVGSERARNGGLGIDEALEDDGGAARVADEMCAQAL